MKTAQIESFVDRYLQATRCQIIERGPGYVQVKLSPEADQALTNRPYYWSFVARTGAEAETMSFTFITDPAKAEAAEAAKSASKPKPQQQQPPQNADSILGRYLGIVPATQPGGRVLKETLTFGSARLSQIFRDVKQRGKYVYLYELPPDSRTKASIHSIPYASWLCVNYKVEFACDMKREELHSLAISLSTGEIVERFHDRLQTKQLTPRLPANTHIRETISLRRALTDLESYLEKKVRKGDHDWAVAARERLEDELERIRGFYEDQLEAAEPDQKADIEAHYENRKAEIRWQYEPKVLVSVVGCGIFNLLDDKLGRN